MMKFLRIHKLGRVKRHLDITKEKGCWKLSIFFLCFDILYEVGKAGYKDGWNIKENIIENEERS